MFICLEISVLGYRWKITLIVVEIACGLGELKLSHGWLSLNMIMLLTTLYMYDCLGGERRWTPLFGRKNGMDSIIIKLAEVSRVKVLKSHIYMSVGSLRCDSVKWQEIEVLNWWMCWIVNHWVVISFWLFW